MAHQQRSTVRVSQREPGLEQRLRTFKAMQLIWLAVAVLEAMIGLRIIFKVSGVNAVNIFASLLYGVTDLFLFPFAGLTATPVSGNSVLEISSLIAMVFYLLVAWGVAKLVEVLFYRPRAGNVNVTEASSSEQHTGLPNASTMNVSESSNREQHTD